jgi:proline iminopeptidase
MKRKLLATALGLVILPLIGAAILWRWMTGPAYYPGQIIASPSLIARLTPPAQAPGRSDWEVEPGIRLHHFFAGRGKNVLIIHGGPGYPFQAPLSALSPMEDRFCFHYYDQRGCGRSTRPVNAFASRNYYKNFQMLNSVLGLEAQIGDIERIRRILGDQQIILMGHSFGAFLASLYAAEFPEHVKGLVLLAPANVLKMPADGIDLFQAIERQLPPAEKQEYQAFMKSYLDFGNIFNYSESALQKMNNRLAYFYAKSGAMAIPAGDNADISGGWMVQAMYLSMGRRHDYRDALHKVNAPVLVLHGDRDLQTEEASRLYAEHFPNARFETINRAGHFAYADQPEIFAVKVGSFLNRLNK